MGNAAMENKRVRGAITEALFRLLEQKNFSEISVSDIVRESGVARASFYRNFENIETVIDSFILELHDRIITSAGAEPFDPLSPRASIIARLEQTFLQVLSQRRYILILFHSGFGSRLQNIADRYIEELAVGLLRDPADKYLLYCFSGAGMNMIFHWLLDGAEKSPHDLAVSCTSFFLQGRHLLLPRK